MYINEYIRLCFSIQVSHLSGLPIGYTEKWYWAAKITRTLAGEFSGITLQVACQNFYLVWLKEDATVEELRLAAAVQRNWAFDPS